MAAVGGLRRSLRAAPRLSHRTFAVLSHKWAGGAAGVPDSGPKRVCLLMHGILGSKNNWNTPARRLLKEIGPRGWKVLQVDHRAHGQSPAGAPPGHTLEDCVDDVLETLTEAGVQVGTDELVVCGHSFGGKVALAVLKRLLDRGTPPSMTWTFDSVPGLLPERREEAHRRKPESTLQVLDMLEEMEGQSPWADRAALMYQLENVYGISTPIAGWLAQSTRSTPCGGLELSYCMRTVRSMYGDYLDNCFFDLLESGEARIGVVVAGRNKQLWGPENLERLENCQGVQVEVLDAGHNIHVDNLPGLLKVLEPTFS